MPISSEELYEYLVQEGYKKADGGVLAEHMREFSRDYYHETRTSPAMVYALWECFKQSRETVELFEDLETCSRQPPFRYVKEDGKLYRFNSKITLYVDNISNLNSNTEEKLAYVKETKTIWKCDKETNEWTDTKKYIWTEVKDSYFRNILKKAWKVEIDKDGIQWVNLNNQKKLRLRKQKV